MHPYPSGPAPVHFNIDDYMNDVVLTSEKRLGETVEETVPDDIVCRTQVVVGHPADEIIRLAESEKADAIVIATHGRTGWRHLVFGSVAEKVVRLAGCPVISIPAPKQK
jgi:nucleotide-binding universal stress UspA family protein